MKKTWIVTVLLASALLASCGDVGTDPKTTENTDFGTEKVTETEKDELTPDLPEMNFNGYEFRVISRGAEDVHWKSRDVYAESMTGDAVNDAVYTRNAALADRYNFKIKEIAATDGKNQNIRDDVIRAVQGDEDLYDVALSCLGMDMQVLSAGGYLFDLNEMPYMDLSRPWYDQSAKKQLSIAGKLYEVIGDMLVMDNDATIAVLFNKRIAEENDLDNMYEQVKAGKWTIDVMLKNAKAAARDLDGAGEMDADDRWGLIGEPFNTYAYVAGMGGNLTKKNKDDEPEFVLQNDHFYSAVERAVELNGDYSICMYSEVFRPQYNDVWSECIDKAFLEGRVLYNVAGLVRVTVFRSMDIDFGILPLPKYDEQQEAYHSPVSGTSETITVPVTADPEKSGFFIEAVSAESMKTLTPAYNEGAIKGKGARDEESLGMLDLIFANRVYDLCTIYDWGRLWTTIMDLSSPNKKAGAASTIASLIDTANAELEDTLELFRKDE